MTNPYVVQALFGVFGLLSLTGAMLWLWSLPDPEPPIEVRSGLALESPLVDGAHTIWTIGAPYGNQWSVLITGGNRRYPERVVRSELEIRALLVQGWRVRE